MSNYTRAHYRSPPPDSTEHSIFEVFENGVIVDTTPLVARKGIAQATAAISSGSLLSTTAPTSPGFDLLTQPLTPGSHATELSTPRLSDGTAASFFDMGALSDAL